MKTRVVIDGREFDIEYDQPFISNGHTYAICSRCHKLVRLDKPFVGSLHCCE